MTVYFDRFWAGAISFFILMGVGVVVTFAVGFVIDMVV